jgi:cytochrome c5
MGTSVELARCPFCNETKDFFIDNAISGINKTGKNDLFWVTCNSCFSAGPQADTKKKAAEKWNKRAEDGKHDKF